MTNRTSTPVRPRRSRKLAHLIASAHDLSTLIYADELVGDDATVLFTRTAPAGSTRRAGRIALQDVAPHLRSDATVYICGSTGFTNAASELALRAGFDERAIRVERFGPTN